MSTGQPSAVSFPGDFVWGTSTASFQIEGAWLEGGKGMSIWDAFLHTPRKSLDGATGDVTCDHYHRWKEDVAMMADLGFKAYRLSLAWSRIQPSGRGPVNTEGIRFYSNVIDELLKHGITPWVTIYHWDLPLALQMELDGWVNPALANLYKDYAVICFKHFGDRVKHWITFNEPWVFALAGYGDGVHAPGRISNIEPYMVGHTVLRAHALAVREYREKFAPTQHGKIMITLNCDWREPATNAPADIEAAERAVEFFLGWFADPVFKGDYPAVMRSRLGRRLPEFTEDERAMVHGSADMFALNHYSTMYAADASTRNVQAKNAHELHKVADDPGVTLSVHPAWAQSQMGWAIVPWGFTKLLHWIDKRYNHPDIVITENGCALPDVLDENAVDDPQRIEYLDAYLSACQDAIDEGVNLKGYFLWSLMDNLEWAAGLQRRFGVCYVDFPSGRRIPKLSAHWYSQVIRGNALHRVPDNPFREVKGRIS
jgi:beta-galactosidase